VNGLPIFTAVLAVPRTDVVLVAIGGSRASAWSWGREGVYCHLGSQIDFCRGDTVCMPETPGYSTGVCCRPPHVNWAGMCCDPCPPGSQRLDRFRCACSTVCPPCPAVGMTQDPKTCICQCPQGQIPCNGVCCDPTNDRTSTCCGGCPGAVCDPFDEFCCSGVCTKIGTDQNCRDCGDQVPGPAGRCCTNSFGAFAPTQLGTSTNCSDCGDRCTGGRVCTNYVCQCPSGTRQCLPGGTAKPCCPNARDCCGNGDCCPIGSPRCCNNRCTNVNTDPANCGSCGNICPVGATCQQGQCLCPLISGLPASGVRQIVCSRGGVPTCMDNFSTPAGANFAWVQNWVAAFPGQPWFTCPGGGMLTCHPSLAQIGQGCCPGGSNGVNQTGQCTCPPGQTVPINGWRCV
jgi:hypothetical protein